MTSKYFCIWWALKKILVVKCMLKVKVIPQSNVPFPLSGTAHERRLTRRNVSLVILKKGKVVNIFSYQGCFLSEKIQSSFHVDLNVKIMVSKLQELPAFPLRTSS